MNYPTISEVDGAGIEQLARWYRFLPSPNNELQVEIMNKVVSTFDSLGGFTPELSKRIGWG